MPSTIEKITELQSQCDQLEQNSAPEKPVIAVCGLMNAGKSYLLNMLTQHIEQEYFKTADQRETITNKVLETDQYIYLDTPGLDASSQDDAIAKQGISNADIVLFVHQPQGELESIEMDFLLQLKDNFGKAAKHSIIIVISKIDKETSSKIDAIDEAIQKQCLKYLNLGLTTIQVSNTRYKTGVTQHKDGLIDASHINVLMQHLHKIRSKVPLTRHNKLSSSIQRLRVEVETLMLDLRDEKAAIQKDISNQFSDFNTQMDQLQAFLIESANNFKKI